MLTRYIRKAANIKGRTKKNTDKKKKKFGENRDNENSQTHIKGTINCKCFKPSLNGNFSSTLKLVSELTHVFLL